MPGGSVANPELDPLPMRDGSRMLYLGTWLAEIDKEFAYATHMTLRGMNLKATDSGWLIVLKAYSKKGPVVAFVGGTSLLEAYRNLWVCISHKKLVWRADRFTGR